MYPLKKAVLWILLVTFIVSGIPWIAFLSYAYLLQTRKKDPKYQIVALAQRTQSGETLKNVFLAELLGLSVDQPINLYAFNINEAKNKLLNFPCIKEAGLKRIPPGILSIDYVLRKPIAFLGDFSNTAIDDEHYAFPFHPFYSPKKLPSLTLGLNHVTWGKKILDPKIQLAFQVLESMDNLEPVQVDVSLADASSLGDQKIIVQFAGHDVLLDPIQFKDGLIRYKEWRKISSEDKELTLIDLRLPRLGFIKKEI